MTRRGMGRGKGSGYYNMMARDPYIHGLSAKGVKTYAKLTKKQKKAIGRGIGTAIGLVAGAQATRGTGYEGIGAIAGGYAGYEIGGSLSAKGRELTKEELNVQRQQMIMENLKQGRDYAVLDYGEINRESEYSIEVELPEDLDFLAKKGWIFEGINSDYDLVLRRQGAQLDAKKNRDWMRTVIKFEDLNPDYPSSQMEGVKIEVLERKYQDLNYIDEKIENTKRFYTGALDNFGHRIKDKELQKEFRKRLKSGKLDAKSKKINNRYYRPVETFSDFQSMDIKEVKEILKSMGAVVKPVKKVKMGKLTLKNLNIDYTMPMEYTVKHKDGSSSFPIMWNPNQKIKQKKGDTLVVEAVGKEESLIKYAHSIKEEYKNMSNKELKEYSPLGRKRGARAEDELLRRGSQNEKTNR